MLSLFSSEAVNFEVWLCFLFFLTCTGLKPKSRQVLCPAELMPGHMALAPMPAFGAMPTQILGTRDATTCKNQTAQIHPSALGWGPPQWEPTDPLTTPDPVSPAVSITPHPSLISMSCRHPVLPTGVTVPASHPAGARMCFREGRRRMGGKRWWLDKRTELRNSPLSSLESSLRKKFTYGQMQ